MLILLLCTCSKVTNTVEGVAQGFLANWWLKLSLCLLDAGQRAEECPTYQGLSSHTVTWNKLHSPFFPSLNTPPATPSKSLVFP